MFIINFFLTTFFLNDIFVLTFIGRVIKVNGYITKPWDWSKNKDEYWLVPCRDSAFLAERWQGAGYKKFLDLGCGLGRHSIYMAEKGFDTTAADLSDYGIGHLKRWASEAGVSVSATVCDMTDLPFDDNSFDCLMAYNVIYHTDTEGFCAALSEIRRVLRDGGELFLTLISKNTYSYQNADKYLRIDNNTLLRTEDNAEKDVPHFYVDIDDIKRLFTDWSFEFLPVEWCDYDLNDSSRYSKHWMLLLKKQKDKKNEIS